MIGFVVAMEKEARLFLEKTTETKEKLIAGKRVFSGKYLDTDFTLIISGIGKVNAALATQVLIDKFTPDYIINFGVAGGKENSGLQAGDIVLLDKICQYDFDLSEIDNVNIGYMQDYDTTYYTTAYKRYIGNNFVIKSGASGDRFTRQRFWLDIIKELKAGVVDMESGAIAQVCSANQVEFFSLKLISDTDGKEESIFEQYANNVTTICNKIPDAIRELVNNI